MSRFHLTDEQKKAIKEEVVAWVEWTPSLGLGIVAALAILGAIVFIPYLVLIIALILLGVILFDLINQMSVDNDRVNKLKEKDADRP